MPEAQWEPEAQPVGVGEAPSVPECVPERAPEREGLGVPEGVAQGEGEAEGLPEGRAGVAHAVTDWDAQGEAVEEG